MMKAARKVNNNKSKRSLNKYFQNLENKINSSADDEQEVTLKSSILPAIDDSTFDSCQENSAIAHSSKDPVLRNATEDKHSCDICEKKFGHISNMYKHRRIHTGEKPHACYICEMKFNQSQNMIRHIKRIHKKFSSKDDLDDNLKREPNIQEKISSKSKMKIGKKRSATEDKQSCDICGKRFGQPNQMLRHRRIHTGEKPYACDICGMKFSVSHNMTRHIKLVHKKISSKDDLDGNLKSKMKSVKKKVTKTLLTGYKKPFDGRKFALSQRITRHRLVYVKVIPYSCPVCSKTFSTKSNLNKHLVKKRCQHKFNMKKVDVRKNKSDLKMLPNNEKENGDTITDEKDFQINQIKNFSNNYSEINKLAADRTEPPELCIKDSLVDTYDEEIETQIEIVPKLNIKRALGLKAWWLAKDQEEKINIPKPHNKLKPQKKTATNQEHISKFEKNASDPVVNNNNDFITHSLLNIGIKKQKTFSVDLSKSKKLVNNYLKKSTKYIYIGLSRKEIPRKYLKKLI